MAVSVLIVEDDRNIAELLQMYLEKEGYAVTVAADGGQGLAKFRAIKPDLVLLDVMMPVMDGWSVCMPSFRVVVDLSAAISLTSG